MGDRPFWIVIAVMVALATVALVLEFGGRMPSRNEVLSEAAGTITAPAEDLATLLARLDAILAQRAPALAQRLRPGLTEEQVRRRVLQHEVVLHADAVALWRWHDGTDPRAPMELFPGGRFECLDFAIERLRRARQEADLLRQQQQFVPRYKLHSLPVFQGVAVDWMMAIGASAPPWIDSQPDGQAAGRVWPTLAHLLGPVVHGWESGVLSLDGKGRVVAGPGWVEVMQSKSAGFEW